MIHAGWVVDARSGGLVLGRTHAEGDIIIVHRITDGTDRFIVAAMMEDGEYILNVRASISEKARLDEINQLKGDTPSDITLATITPECHIFNTHADPFDKLLWVDRGQFIVNAFATSKHFAELESLNDIGNAEITCDPSPFLFQ